MRVLASHMPSNRDIETRRRTVSDTSNGGRQANVVALRVGAVELAAVDRDVEFAGNVLELRPQKGKSRGRSQLPVSSS